MEIQLKQIRQSFLRVVQMTKTHCRVNRDKITKTIPANMGLSIKQNELSCDDFRPLSYSSLNLHISSTAFLSIKCVLPSLYM